MAMIAHAWAVNQIVNSTHAEILLVQHYSFLLGHITTSLNCQLFIYVLHVSIYVLHP